MEDDLIIEHQKPKNVWFCEHCNFSDNTEENVLNHTIIQHSSFTCDLCEYQTLNEENLAEHETNEHRRTKYTCTKCAFYFNSEKKLSEHKSKKHRENVFQCDHCKLKSESITTLDRHIETCHTTKRNKNVDIRDFSDWQPCNFSTPRTNIIFQCLMKFHFILKWFKHTVSI